MALGEGRRIVDVHPQVSNDGQQTKIPKNVIFGSGFVENNPFKCKPFQYNETFERCYVLLFSVKIPLFSKARTTLER